MLWSAHAVMQLDRWGDRVEPVRAALREICAFLDENEKPRDVIFTVHPPSPICPPPAGFRALHETSTVELHHGAKRRAIVATPARSGQESYKKKSTPRTPRSPLAGRTEVAA